MLLHLNIIILVSIVQSNNYNLAVECPHPYIRILNDARKINKDVLELKDINDFIITHLHSDHCGGLETLGFYKKFVENKKLIVRMNWNDTQNHRNMVYPSMGTTLINDAIIKLDNYDYFEYRPIGENNPVKCGPFKIKSEITEHYVASHAVIIRKENKSLGFSGDTKFDRNVLEWLGKTDFILHETGPTPGHTPLENLSSLPMELKRKIRLIHYSDDIDTNDFKLAKEGETIWV